VSGTTSDLGNTTVRIAERSTPSATNNPNTTANARTTPTTGAA
jgi:hypothetical protein